MLMFPAGLIDAQRVLTAGGQKESRDLRMIRSEMIAVIDEELAKLTRVRELLQKSNSDKLVSRLSAAPAPKRQLSADARQRIANAQKKRWAKRRREMAAAKK
jgi:hypothetical protein